MPTMLKWLSHFRSPPTEYVRSLRPEICEVKFGKKTTRLEFFDITDGKHKTYYIVLPEGLKWSYPSGETVSDHEREALFRFIAQYLRNRYGLRGIVVTEPTY